MKSLAPGSTGSFQGAVGDADTAVALGSGSVPVLATPRLIAWLEAAAVDALQGAIPEGSTSVGTSIDVRHLAATPIGGIVTATAKVISVEGRSVAFDLHATDEQNTIATGTHIRVVVDLERFLARL